MHTQADIGRCVQTAICVVYEDVHASLTRNRNHAYSNAGPCTQCSAYHTTDGDGKTNACSCYDVATGAINASVRCAFHVVPAPQLRTALFSRT